MKLFVNGAARTVTGSQLILEANGERLLLEFGLYQGKRADSYLENQCCLFDIGTVKAMVLSHAHIDHSGNLPNLVKHGFDRPIYATSPTVRLATIMLRDSGHIQEADTEYVNKKRFRRGEPPVSPLYTLEDAVRVVPYFRPVEYNQVFQPIKGVTVHLVDAGHILGSAAVVLDVEEHGRTRRLWFSGDIGRDDLPLLDNPVLPQDADYLVMECTYGDKLREEPGAAYRELREVVLRTINRRGKVIIPAFAVGRTQELVYDLNQMISRGELPHVPVYVDSPLAVNASDIFREYSDLLDSEAREFVRRHRHPALDFDGLTYIRSADESIALNEHKEPMIIISASGMAEQGRIRHHIKNNIEDARNTILIVSWQAPETLGRRLAEGERVVKIFGENYYRRADVVTIGGFSAHADQGMLLKYAMNTKNSLKKVVLVHGEPRSALPFQELLQDKGFRDVEYPAKGEMIELE